MCLKNHSQFYDESNDFWVEGTEEDAMKVLRSRVRDIYLQISGEVTEFLMR
jgi:hypothetical protein